MKQITSYSILPLKTFRRHQALHIDGPYIFSHQSSNICHPAPYEAYYITQRHVL